MTRQSRRAADNLPGELTSFVGRRQTTARVKRLLSTSRLVTLTGIAGVGKSRLALRVAGELRRAFADGVRLVELAEIDHPPLVVHAVAMALQVPNTSARDLGTRLADHLADKGLLLVLDNCEHLLDTCAELVGRLLASAPGLRVLATSREPLGTAGEYVHLVPPLSVPNVEESSTRDDGLVHQYEALRLFQDRASAVLPGFALNRDNEQAAAQLCRRLDGLPLAIELAAVQVRALSVQEILTRLQDRYGLLTVGSRAAAPRHQTLRAAVAWSFDLCTELERTLWARLSVFAGEFDLDAAENVCADDGLPTQDVLPGVAGLVDKSILIREEPDPCAQYRMLDTIRQYGQERLADSGDELTLRRRHRDYYLRLSEAAEADWFSPRQQEWLRRFQLQQSNRWAALEFCFTQPDDVRTGLRMAGTLGVLSIPAGSLYNGRRCVDRALTVGIEPSRERAKALWVDAWISLMQGDVSRALSVLDECINLAQQLDDETALGYAMQWAGVATMYQNRLPDALAYLEQAVDQQRAAGEINAVTTLALCHLGDVARGLGDRERAAALCMESMAICEAHGDYWTRSWTLWHTAVGRWSAGDIRQAGKHASESLRLKRTLGDPLGIPFCVEMLAWVAMADGDAERAAVLFGVTEMMWRLVDCPMFGWHSLLAWSAQSNERAREVLGMQAFDAACQRGMRFTMDEAVAYALCEEQTSRPGAPTTPALAQLTSRERQVADLVTQGLANKEVAAKLVISQRTAENHIERIMHKLGFKSRTQIAAWLTEQRQT